MIDTMDLTALASPEIEALGLAEAAVLMDQARAAPDDKGQLAAALDRNLNLWVGIKSLVEQPDCALPAEVKDNLVRLSAFVTGSILKHGVDIPAETMDTLTNINLQIAEGLLEGRRKA